MVSLLALMGCPDPGEVDPTPPLTPTPIPAPPVEVIPDEGPAMVEAYLAGRFETLAAFQGLADVSGSALLVKNLDGSTDVSVALSGLTPSETHSVHVHVWPCAYLAGGHYKLDPAVEETLAENEMWPDVTADELGNGTSTLSVDHWTRGDALAVVVHDPATNDKMACADLAPAATVGGLASGTFAPFADYEKIDSTITGTAEATLSSTTSSVTVSLQGLDDTASYAAHVHQQPCDVLYGSGHYKKDPTVEETDVLNEIWPEILPVGGSASVTVSEPAHALREDAQAVVLHRDGPKVACADLTRQGYVGLRTSGSFYNTPDADARGLTVGGSATIHRRIDGTTVVEVQLSGLPPGAEHPVHVHTLPCDVEGGGGHYIVDPLLPEGETNELWPSVTADAAGSGSRAIAVTAMARADAQSVVVHDGADNTKLACADLE